MSIVTIAWLAVETAPAGQVGLFVGLAIAAYTLPGAERALALGRYLRHRPARALVLGHCLLRAALPRRDRRALWRRERSHQAHMSHCSSAHRSWRAGGTRASTPCSRSSAERTDASPPTRLRAHRSGSRRLSGQSRPASSHQHLSRLGARLLDAASFAFLGVQAWRTTPPLRRPRSRSTREQPNPAFASSVVTGSSACSSSRGCSSSSTGLSRTPFLPPGRCPSPPRRCRTARPLLDELRRRGPRVDPRDRDAPRPRHPSSRSPDRRRLGRLPSFRSPSHRLPSRSCALRSAGSSTAPLIPLTCMRSSSRSPRPRTCRACSLPPAPR